MPRGVNWEDLPASVRHRIQDHRTEERVRATSPMPGQSRWLCCGCGEVLTSWAAAERHADEQGHTRIELVLDRADDGE